MLFLHLYIETGALVQLDAADTDESTKLNQTLLMKKST